MPTEPLAALDQTPDHGWRWYHGLGALVSANLLALTLGRLVGWAAGNTDQLVGSSDEQREYFEALKQTAFAPPAWAFGPVWITNNVCALAGLIKVLNLPTSEPGRPAYLKLQAASWLIYVSFTPAYFGLRSPINACALTVGMWGLTGASVQVARRKLGRADVAWSLSPQLVWLTLASAVAVCQVLWNHDDLYAVGPFTEPPAWLLRAQDRG